VRVLHTIFCKRCRRDFFRKRRNNGDAHSRNSLVVFVTDYWLSNVAGDAVDDMEELIRTWNEVS
jgi:hypothetical protein